MAGNRDIRIQLNRADVDSLRELMSALDAPSRAKALTRALNKTAKGVRTDISREIRARVNIKAKDVKDGIKLWLANTNRPSVRITIKGTRRRLVLFGARQTKTGVSVQVYKAQGRKIIPHAFINRGKKTGREDVFWRVKGGNGKLVGRYPIVTKFGLALPEAFEWTSREVVEAQARERLKKNLEHEIDYLLQQSRLAALDGNLESNDT
jgi:hypothetical protein